MANDDISEEEVLTRGAHATDLFNAPFFTYIGDYITHDLLQKIVHTEPDEGKKRELLWLGIYGARLHREHVFDFMQQSQQLLELRKREAEDKDAHPGDY